MSVVDAGFVLPIPEFLSTLHPELLSQGAEALTLKVDNPENPDKKCVAKYRPPKSWRIAELDKQLRKKRTIGEGNVLKKLTEAGIPCPALVREDLKNGLLYMEFIDGETLKQYTWNKGSEIVAVKPVLSPIFYRLGELVAQMHMLNVTHGDLTTSNALVKDGELFIIDFGLSNRSSTIEDKAVDIYVLERAIESTHAGISSELVKFVLAGYDSGFTDRKIYEQIIQRLDVVRQRGRKRSMLG